MSPKTANGTSRKLKNVDWWDEPDTLPVVVDPRKGKIRRRLITVYLWVSAILFPFLIFAVIVLAVRIVAPPSANAGAGPDNSVTREAAQAQVAVERWLGETPSPLPGGRVVAYTGSTSKAAQQREGQRSEPRTLTTYSFVLADSAGRMYDTSIQLVISDEGAVALADPSFVPILPANPEAGGQTEWPWPGVASIAAAPEYAQAVNAWTKAYTGGDPAALKLAVGDPAADRFYMPLTGVSFTDLSIGQVGALWADDQDRTKESKPRQALLRVTVSAVWASQRTATQQPTLTYDLLLDRADTAAPGVVAWGPPGADLTPYNNAVGRNPRPATR
ncbi:hypothetical protein [Microlunatus speluncae]|uniref:hypothetical protein n=1 Tax=Microlunatus speluncae TaxID=2594267 RepID=UPI00126661CD|nr:hypothetical protein [Microlunatus speluncae]